MTNIDPFQAVLTKSHECIACHRILEVSTEKFDANLGNIAAEANDHLEAAIECEGWVNGYCDTCVARGFGKDD